MKKNFRIADLFILIESSGAMWDLRNEFILSRIEIEDSNSRARIIFSKVQPAAKEEEALAVEFFHTKFVKCSVDLNSAADAGGRRMAFIGYLPKEERSGTDKCYPEVECDDPYCIIFKFEGSSYITISGNAAFAYAIGPDE